LVGALSGTIGALDRLLFHALPTLIGGTWASAQLPHFLLPTNLGPESVNLKAFLALIDVEGCCHFPFYRLQPALPSASGRPVVPVPGACWNALRLHPDAAYVPVASALSPEFTPDREKISAGPEWAQRYAGAAPWATPESLRDFVGPNWLPDE